MDLETGELIIVRLWRWAPERIKLDAEKEVRQSREPSISVFGLSRLPGEDLEALMKRLASYVATIRSAKYAAFTTADKLAEAGFGIRPSVPPEHHFDVLIQDHNDEAELSKLSKVFSEFERRHFPSCLTAAA